MNRLGQIIQAALELLVTQLELPDNWKQRMPVKEKNEDFKKQREDLTNGEDDRYQGTR